MLAATLFGIQAIWLTTWLTPLWILGVGCLLGLILIALVCGAAFLLSRVPPIAALARNRRVTNALGAVLAVALTCLCGYVVFRQDPGAFSPVWILLLAPIFWIVSAGLLTLVSRRAVDETLVTIREGVLWPLMWVVVLFAAISLIGWGEIRNPAGILASATRIWPVTGHSSYSYTIPPAEQAADEFAARVRFRNREVRQIVFRSSGLLEINVIPNSDEVFPFTEIDGTGPKGWRRGAEESLPFPHDEVDAFYIRNLAGEPVSLKIDVVTAPVHPEAASIPITALCVLGVFLLYSGISARFPKISAIALATYKSEIVQPLFLILVATGGTALVIFLVIPYHTFGEDIKVLKDSGLTLILVLCVIQAVWAASTSIAEEIEGRTALTVLSKPLTRRDFIIGKYVGIMWTVALMVALLGAVLLICVAYKPIYDARESSNPEATWQLCYFETARTIPGLVLLLMEVSVLTAISVAISTRFSLLPNMAICLMIYVLGHLTPMIVSGSSSQFEIVQFFGQLIATVFPNLDSFNIQAAISSGARVPPLYLAKTFVYSALFSIVALLAALLMFEERDLT